MCCSSALTCVVFICREELEGRLQGKDIFHEEWCASLPSAGLGAVPSVCRPTGINEGGPWMPEAFNLAAGWTPRGAQPKTL